MPVQFKKIGVKALLGLLEAAKWLGLSLFWLLKILSYPLLVTWRYLLRPLAFLGYRQFIRLRAATGTMFEPVRRTLLAALGHRYVVSGMMALIIVFVAAHNLYAYNADLEAESKDSLLYGLLQPAADEISFAANDAAESDLFASATATGEAYAYDQTGVLRPFPVFPPPPGETRIVISSPELYVVESGDTVSGIARRYGLSVSTVLWANDMTLRSTLRIGQKLPDLPVDGVLHKVLKGDTLAAIAKRYKADQGKILEANRLASADQLRIGEELIVPGGVPPTPPVAKTPSRIGSVGNVFKSPSEAPPNRAVEGTQLAWPTVSRRITQYFKWNHPAIDIGGTLQNPLYAADDGIVTVSGWNKFGYGNMILIDHGNGMITRYGHASALYVKAGDQVQKGQAIAMLGSTGRSTGPHLHFEIYLNGKRRNPLEFYR